MLHLGQENTWNGLGDEGIESKPAENDLEVLVNERLDMIHQCVPEVPKPNSCIRSTLGSRTREDSALLPS